ncbi:MAG: glycosyltransferase family 39 protein [Planctomycetes bacterium]|nr:glycosyltransferase family 39 protein [Planctomycetota bacterium]
MREPSDVSESCATSASVAPCGADGGVEADLPRLVAWIVCLVCVAGWGAYLASTLGTIEYEGLDEARYLHYATQVSTHGPSAFPGLFTEYLGDPAAQRVPNPLRVLYIVASAGWCGLFGASFASLSSLSLACHLLTVLVTFAAARKYFGEARALVFACTLALSPLLSGLARRALMDSFATLTLGLAIWSFLAWTRDFASRRRALLFAATLFVALTTKENHVLFVPAFVIFLVWLAFGRRERVPWRVAAAAFGVPSVLAGLVFVGAAGGFEPLVSMLRVIIASPATNKYAQRFGDGPWYRYIIDFLMLSPWITLASLGAAGAVLLGRALRGREALEFLVVLVVVGLAMLALFTKNVRYLAFLEIAWRGLAAAFLFELFGRFGARAALWGGLALGAVACAVDAATFRFLFLANGLYDPITAALLSLRDIVQPPLRK